MEEKMKKTREEMDDLRFKESNIRDLLQKENKNLKA